MILIWGKKNTGKQPQHTEFALQGYGVSESRGIAKKKKIIIMSINVFRHKSDETV